MLRFEKVLLNPKEFSKFAELAEASIPNEICAVLIGKIYANIAIVDKIYIAKNISTSIPQFDFLMDPEDFHKALELTDWLTDGAEYTYLGIIHSHPTDSTSPSEIDKKMIKEGAVNEGAYLIYSAVTHQIGPYPLYVDNTQTIRLLSWLV